MSYPNQDFTLHQMHRTKNPNCEYCYEPYYRSRSYQRDLRAIWLGMVEKYPHLYAIDDYFTACERANITVF